MTDERRELWEIARALRAHAEWQLETGALGLSKGTTVAVPADPLPSPPARELAPAPVFVPASNPFEAIRESPPPQRPRVSLPEVPPDPAMRKARLVELAAELRDCKRCELHRQRTQIVFARGNPEAELCFIGEGPGADEDARGVPFVGRAGQLLDRMIAAMGFSLDEVYVCNIVKCRPPENRKPLPEEMAACSPYLAEQLALVSPKVIVALGATATEGLLGSLPGGISRTRGQWKLYNRAIPLMPTFHPAYVLRSPKMTRPLVWADLQAVAARLGRPVSPSRS